MKRLLLSTVRLLLSVVAVTNSNDASLSAKGNDDGHNGVDPITMTKTHLRVQICFKVSPPLNSI